MDYLFYFIKLKIIIPPTVDKKRIISTATITLNFFNLISSQKPPHESYLF